MSRIGNLFSDLKEQLSTASNETEQLDRDEKREKKYLDKEDIPHSIETFSEEVRLAEDIAESLENAEEDELEIEDIAGKKGQISEEMKKQFNESEQETEHLVNRFLNEMKILRNEAGQLKKEMKNSDVSSEERRKFEEDMQLIEDAVQKTEQVRKEGEQVMNRREMLKSTAGVAAAATGASKLSKDVNPVKEAETLEKKKTEQQKATTQTTKREGSKPKADIGGGKGKLVEKRELGEGIVAEARILRTSSDTGLTLIKVTNKGSEGRRIDMKLQASGWMFSGLMNYNQSNGNTAEVEADLPPGRTYTSGALLVKTENTPGELEYELVTESKRFGQLELNMPGTMVEGHAVKKDSLKELNLDYALAQRSEGYELQLEMKNSSGQALVATATFGIPNGWSYSGGEHITTSSAGLVATRGELDRGGRQQLDIFLSRQDESASSIGTLSVVAFPEGEPGKASHYIVPVVLK